MSAMFCGPQATKYGSTGVEVDEPEYSAVPTTGDGLRTHRQLTDAAAIWDDLGRDPGALYRSTRLALAQEWAERDGHDRALTSLERAFLAAGLRAS
jgi:hypothetical protein